MLSTRTLSEFLIEYKKIFFKQKENDYYDYEL